MSVVRASLPLKSELAVFLSMQATACLKLRAFLFRPLWRRRLSCVCCKEKNQPMSWFCINTYSNEYCDISHSSCVCECHYNLKTTKIYDIIPTATTSSFAVSLLFNNRVFHADAGCAVSLSTVTKQQDPRAVFRVPLPLLSPLNFSQGAQGFSPSIEIFTILSPSEILRLTRYASPQYSLPRYCHVASKARLRESITLPPLRPMPSGFPWRGAALYNVRLQMHRWCGALQSSGC